jgi:hypothetical protein
MGEEIVRFLCYYKILLEFLFIAVISVVYFFQSLDLTDRNLVACFVSLIFSVTLLQNCTNVITYRRKATR